MEDAVRDEGEGGHTTRHIESTTGRDETVTALCLPPPDPRTGAVEHVYVVGSSAAALAAPGPSQAYIISSNTPCFYSIDLFLGSGCIV